MSDDRLGPREDEHEGVSDDAPSLSDDRLYRGLAARQRRRLLFTLLDEEEMSVEEIATLLTGWVAAEGGLMATPSDYEEIRINLVHNHLPVLDDIGFVDYDLESGTVRLESLDAAVTALIRQSVTTEPPTRS